MEVAHLCLSFVKHVRCWLLQVFFFYLGSVVNVYRVGRTVRQVCFVDGASFCFKLETKK